MTEKEDFATLLGQFEKQQDGSTRHEPKQGDKVSGEIISIQGDRVFVDLGFKTEGVAETGELSDDNGNLTVAVGDTIEIAVSGKDEVTGTLLLGSRHAHRLHGSAALQEAFDEQLPVEGRVTGTTKGGLEVDLSGVRAFCPASQADIRFVEDLQDFVGQRLAFRITKFEGGRHPNLVVSRRALLEEEQRALAAETRSHLEVGAVLKGRVTALKEFGAFVDLGGVEGMVHISELSFRRVQHPEEILSVGQEVEVAVIRIDKTDNPRHPERIALSIRALDQDPWQEALVRFPEGAHVQGTVTRIQPFGAFVEIAPGIDGLVHISELGAGRRVNHPQEVVGLGEQVEATVLSVDPDKHRISLSLDTARQSGDNARANHTANYSNPKPSFGTLGDLLKESLKKN